MKGKGNIHKGQIKSCTYISFMKWVEEKRKCNKHDFFLG